MSCGTTRWLHLIDRLFVDGKIASWRFRRLWRHLDSCEPCRAYYDRAATAWEAMGGANQLFTLHYQEGATFFIVAREGSQVLDVEKQGTAAGTRVIPGPINGGDNQRFRFFPHPSAGTYCIVASHSGGSLDTARQQGHNGAGIVQDSRGEASQWRLVPASPALTRFGVVEFTEGQPAASVLREPLGQSAMLNGWLDAEDGQIVGDFRGLGRDQLLCINRAGSAGRLMLCDLGGTAAQVVYWESYGDSPLFAGWLDTNDLCLSGNFLGRRVNGQPVDQLLLVNRGGSGGRVMVADFSKGGPPVQTRVLDVWGQGPWLEGWLDGNDWHLAGDFMGRGHAQWMMINRTPSGGRMRIADFAGGQRQDLYLESWDRVNPLGGWLDDNDVLLVGDFLGVGHDQLLAISRRPDYGRAMILDYQTGTAVARFLDRWAERGALDELCGPGTILRAGRFRGGRAQLLGVRR